MPTYENVKYLTLPQQVEKNRTDIQGIQENLNIPNGGGGGGTVDWEDVKNKPELQNKLVAGTNITINPTTNVISASGDIGGTVDWQDIENKPELQNKLTAGANITIHPTTNVISASLFIGGKQLQPSSVSVYNSASNKVNLPYGSDLDAESHDVGDVIRIRVNTPELFWQNAGEQEWSMFMESNPENPIDDFQFEGSQDPTWNQNYLLNFANSNYPPELWGQWGLIRGFAQNNEPQYEGYYYVMTTANTPEYVYYEVVIGGTVDWQDIENKPELQNKLTAGDNITIDENTNVISASDYAVGVVETRASVLTKIWTGTQAQYDAIGTKDANTLYFII